MVEKKNKLVTAAKDSDIQVIDVGFLEAVKKGGAASLIKQHSICSWGSEVSVVGNLVLRCFGYDFLSRFMFVRPVIYLGFFQLEILWLSVDIVRFYVRFVVIYRR